MSYSLKNMKRVRVVWFLKLISRIPNRWRPILAAFARPLERGGALTGPAAGSAVEPFDDDTCGSGGSTTSSTVSGGPGASAGGNTSG
ncbi:unnamed protein product, partial [Vitis vinifera]